MDNINWTTDPETGKRIAFVNHDHQNSDGTWGMTSELVNCTPCHERGNEVPATVPMFPATGNTTQAIPMCEACAWEAFNKYTHESDLNDPDQG